MATKCNTQINNSGSDEKEYPATLFYHTRCGIPVFRFVKKMRGLKWYGFCSRFGHKQGIDLS